MLPAGMWQGTMLMQLLLVSREWHHVSQPPPTAQRPRRGAHPGFDSLSKQRTNTNQQAMLIPPQVMTQQGRVHLRMVTVRSVAHLQCHTFALILSQVLESSSRAPPATLKSHIKAFGGVEKLYSLG